MANRSGTVVRDEVRYRQLPIGWAGPRWAIAHWATSRTFARRCRLARARRGSGALTNAARRSLA